MKWLYSRTKRNAVNRVSFLSTGHNKDGSIYFHWYLFPFPFIHVIYASISYSIQSTLSSQFIYGRVAPRIQQIFMHGVKIWKQHEANACRHLLYFIISCHEMWAVPTCPEVFTKILPRFRIDSRFRSTLDINYLLISILEICFVIIKIFDNNNCYLYKLRDV